MGRNKQLAKNTSFVVIGNIGSKLLGFIMLPLYTSWLSPVDYGLTDIISVYANLLINVIACDVSDAIYVFPIGCDYKKIKSYYSTGFFFQIICCLLAIPIFFGLNALPCESAFSTHTWYIYAILASALFQKYIQDFCRGIHKMSVFCYTGIVQSGALALSSILLIPSHGVYGFVLAQVISNILTAMFTFIYSGSLRYLSISSFSVRYLKEMLKFSAPLIPTAVMWWLVSGLNRPLLEQYNGLFAIGLLAVGMKLPSLINLVYNFFQQAWVITVLEEYRKADFSQYFNQMFKLLFGMQILGCLFIIIFAKPFMTLMTTAEYHQAYVYIPLITLGTIFSNMSAFIGTVFTASHQTKYTFYTAIFGGLTAVILNILIIPYYGVWGACTALFWAHFASALSRVYFSRRFVKFACFGYTVKQICMLAITYFVALILDGWQLIIAYVSCMLLFLYVNRQILQKAKCFIAKKNNSKNQTQQNE